ncbi:hypothetical protein DCC81_17975 [Chitinophaga parva]|uniref:Uncharacterized protein n=1 Tax=Chitinophaga parva TaxID=2169414 RepID=A0A2T7BIL8_9BACT|nr:FecR domain-containing protein [Chitinophaga parva]PUZ26127.1 hypothetical protein DCC81_17975 [Chitinophaga parva]
MDLPNQSYEHYTTTTFFEDEQFIRHVLHPDEASVAHWGQVAAQYPAQRTAMEEARIWIQLLHGQRSYQPAVSSQQLWDKIAQDMEQHDRRERQVYRPLRIAARWISAAAAVLIFALLSREWSSLGEKQYATDYGKQEQVVLPDESVITLNGHSAIHYVRTWKSGKPRQIWLQGEAFFEVKHVALQNRLRQSDSFHVYVSDLALTVTGTKFNVRNRRGITEVSLLEGSLRIEKTGPGAFVKMLKPGDAYVYDSSRQLLTTMEGRQPQANRAWTNDELDADGYTLGDILHVLEDTYGYDITLTSPQLAQRTLSGTIPATSADDILFVIRKAFNLKINQKGKHLIISPNL